MTEPLTTAQMEARCREIVADVIAKGQAGKLDALLAATLSVGLRARVRLSPNSQETDQGR